MTALLRVLFIEDLEDDTQLILRELRKGGFDVEWDRVDTRAAMKAALARQTWDLIISDHSMPQFSSLEALDVLRSSGQDLPFLLVSGSIGEDAAVAAMKAGVDDFLMKGNWARLIPAIQRGLRDAQARRERTLAIQALQKSERRFRALIENGLDEIVVFDSELKPIYMSPSVLRASDVSWHDMVEAAPFSSVHPQDQPAAKELYEWMLQHPAEYRAYQLRLVRQDGSVRWTEGVAINLFDDPGVEGILLNYRDITERKQAETKIRQQLDRLTALREIDQAITSVFDVRMSLNILLSHAKRLLGVDAATVLLLDPEQSKLKFGAGIGLRTRRAETADVRFGESYAGTAAREQRLVQIPNLRDDPENPLLSELLKGEEFVSYYGMPLIVKGKVIGVLEVFQRAFMTRDQDWLDFLSTLAGQAAIAIENAQLFDHLQRYNLELEQRVEARTAELNKLNAELQRANRAKDEFLANMSHELRTPLNSILGLSESLLEQRLEPLSERQQNSLQIIESSGRHLLELINDVLDLSKIEAGMLDYYPQPVDVDTLCRSSLAFVKHQAIRKSIRLTYEAGSISKIDADPRRLKQILVNLLANAVKFTPEHGQVTLRVRGDAEQDLVQFLVIDTGIGIAPNDLARLFRPFMQVDSNLNRQFEGTGLGLALVQKLTDLHGGSVQVESEVGVGSCFTINIPWGRERVIQESSEARRAPLTAENLTEFRRASDVSVTRGVVLLAEDNRANILTVGEYLESHGFTVIIAHNGLEAIEKAQQTNPDIILMDVQMPAMDGLESMRRLRDDPRFQSTPIIALTALAMPGDRERCLAAGANEYMSKPVSLKKLLHTIEELYDQAH
jgi:PAS domain S-box-containing protein